jgi:hypothetical protein
MIKNYICLGRQQGKTTAIVNLVYNERHLSSLRQSIAVVGATTLDAAFLKAKVPQERGVRVYTAGAFEHGLLGFNGTIYIDNLDRFPLRYAYRAIVAPFEVAVATATNQYYIGLLLELCTISYHDVLELIGGK